MKNSVEPILAAQEAHRNFLARNSFSSHFVLLIVFLESVLGSGFRIP
jgi:hypothetical protein